MYGDENLNNHNILRYGLTIEFCNSFSSLKYMGIEVPLTLIRHFHRFIKDHVDNNLSNTKYVNELQEKYKIKTMADAQKALYRKPIMKRDLSDSSIQKTILMPGFFSRFALEQFPDSKVILMNANRLDVEALKGLVVPKNFEIYNLYDEVKKTVIQEKYIERLNRQLKKALEANKNHRIFGTAEFKKWISRNSFQSIKMIKALENLIRTKHIGVILDHIEITFPGNVLALFALRNNLTFINAPQLLISDKSVIPTRASHYFIWGNNYRKWYIKRGIHPSKISITGNWRIEHANPKQYMSKNEFIKRLNIPSNNLIITFTTQTYVKEVNFIIMDWIKKSINSLPVTFLIRPHPSDSLDYTEFLQKSKIILTPKNFHLYNILENTDFLMTISSNTAIEAAILKKGIIVLQPKIPYHFDQNNNNSANSFLAKSNAGVAVYNFRDLAAILNKLVKDKTYRESVVNNGQRYLSDTLELKYSPSNVMGDLIRNFLNN